MLPLTPRSLDLLRSLRGLELECSPALSTWEASERSARALFAHRLSSSFEVYPHWQELYEFQQQGVSFLVANSCYYGGVRALLEDDPRLGKTVQALATVGVLGLGGKPAIILCNKALIPYWLEQIPKWCGDIPCLRLDGSAREREAALDEHLTGECFVVASWSSLRLVPSLANYTWSWFIGDEAHVLKNRKSQTSESASRVASGAQHRLLLSATFAEAGPQDYWSPLRTLFAERLLSYWQFVGSFVETSPDPFAGIKLGGPKNVSLWNDFMEPCHLRRKAEDVVTLPQKQHEEIACELPKEQQRFYELVKEQVLLELSEGELYIPSSATRLIRLRQATTCPSSLEPELLGINGKLEVLESLLAERQGLLPMIVLCSFRDGCREAVERLTKLGLRAFYLSKGENSEEATMLLDTGSVDVIVTSPKIGGVGLNFSRSSWTVFLDEPWSSILARQADERTRAIGKEKGVLITKLLAVGTVDTYVARVLRKKSKRLSEAELASSILHYLRSENFDKSLT